MKLQSDEANVINSINHHDIIGKREVRIYDNVYFSTANYLEGFQICRSGNELSTLAEDSPKPKVCMQTKSGSSDWNSI